MMRALRLRPSGQSGLRHRQTGQQAAEDRTRPEHWCTYLCTPWCSQRSTPTVIPQPADQTANRKRRGSHGGRPPAFDRDAYKQRNTVERCINKLKQWRGLATRYDKTATIYQAALHLAGIFIWSAR
ncbi:hypothetical protein EAO74_05470 [Streptomyces sp. gb1(2016)]|uniref:Uncharacterized protein n=1 Tax=Streptomyces sp. gb1(2016) TaxID=1828321 RepID=A0A652LAK0_9ACTN|nr:hypothetical protein EAO74_05470 [Streptomyces sp. gb1(2016)]